MNKKSLLKRIANPANKLKSLDIIFKNEQKIKTKIVSELQQYLMRASKKDLKKLIEEAIEHDVIKNEYDILNYYITTKIDIELFEEIGLEIIKNQPKP